MNAGVPGQPAITTTTTTTADLEICLPGEVAWAGRAGWGCEKLPIALLVSIGAWVAVFRILTHSRYFPELKIVSVVQQRGPWYFGIALSQCCRFLYLSSRFAVSRCFLFVSAYSLHAEHICCLWALDTHGIFFVFGWGTRQCCSLTSYCLTLYCTQLSSHTCPVLCAWQLTCVTSQGRVYPLDLASVASYSLSLVT